MSRTPSTAAKRTSRMALSKSFDEKIQAFACDQGRLDLALLSPSFTMGGKSVSKPNEGIGMDSPALAHILNTAISKLDAADQAKFAKDGWHRSGQIWDGFQHATLGTITTHTKLVDQQVALKCAQLDSFVKKPIKFKPGRLFSTPGDNNRDRAKIILELVFEADDDQKQVEHIADIVKEAVGPSNFQKKTSELHVIIAKNYGAPRHDIPDKHLLCRLGKQMKALDLTVSFRRLAVSAAGSELGYAVDPRLPILCKLPVAFWQVDQEGPQDKSTILWMPGEDEAEVLDHEIKRQQAHATVFLQALLEAHSGQQVSTNSQVERVIKTCTPVSLCSPLPSCIV
ncbi:hypothetical protein DUNSADRAFT_9275 [Dunaliella salina]|uniref:Uncharacterized protein n=1 Tax=Dunaliella salina TaxID=3046 RepID=A0ABQ7GHR7_DUNSA|nr:hypothetical protein DUNSADRAFT_9275 [Dunaliella salina]|eukprot:KAF5834155.1 hypothetical protein DUNSADRAFT_9275 [Dunaliella salina]